MPYKHVYKYFQPPTHESLNTYKYILKMKNKAIKKI